MTQLGSTTIEEIAETLGTELRKFSEHVWYVVIENRALGTRLTLMLYPSGRRIKVSSDRLRKRGPWEIGAVVLGNISAVGRHTLRQYGAVCGQAAVFRSSNPACTLVVTSLGQYQLRDGHAFDWSRMVAPAVDKQRPVTLTGNLARPRYFDGKTGPFWVAGLAEQVPGQRGPTWHNLQARGELALKAKELPKGRRVTVVGVPRKERFTTEQGEEREVVNLHLSSIELVTAQNLQNSLGAAHYS